MVTRRQPAFVRWRSTIRGCLATIYQEIANRLLAEQMLPLSVDDNVLIIGAKREVDTWVTFLQGNAVDERGKFPVEDADGKAGGEPLARR